MSILVKPQIKSLNHFCLVFKILQCFIKILIYHNKYRPGFMGLLLRHCVISWIDILLSQIKHDETRLIFAGWYQLASVNFLDDERFQKFLILFVIVLKLWIKGKYLLILIRINRQNLLIRIRPRQRVKVKVRLILFVNNLKARTHLNFLRIHYRNLLILFNLIQTIYLLYIIFLVLWFNTSS